jgi:hypothetical protein
MLVLADEPDKITPSASFWIAEYNLGAGLSYGLLQTNGLEGKGTTFKPISIEKETITFQIDDRTADIPSSSILAQHIPNVTPDKKQKDLIHISCGLSKSLPSHLICSQCSLMNG